MSKTLAAQISEINRTVISPDMVSLPIGRGYFLGKGYTDAKVHTAAVVSSLKFQKSLLSEFSKSADIGARPNMYLGMGGMMNLSYIASLKPKSAVLIDVNPMQTLFWREIIDDIDRNETIDDFQKAAKGMDSRLRDRLREAFSAVGYEKTSKVRDFVNGESFFRGRIDLHHMMDWPLEDFNWANAQGYGFLKELVSEGKLAPLTLDVADKRGVEQLGQVLSDVSLHGADYVHVSNVISFMKGHKDWLGRSNGRALVRGALDNIELLAASEGTKIITDHACVEVGALSSLDPLHELAR